MTISMDNQSYTSTQKIVLHKPVEGSWQYLQPSTVIIFKLPILTFPVETIGHAKSLTLGELLQRFLIGRLWLQRSNRLSQWKTSGCNRKPSASISIIISHKDICYETEPNEINPRSLCHNKQTQSNPLKHVLERFTVTFFLPTPFKFLPTPHQLRNLSNFKVLCFAMPNEHPSPHWWSPPSTTSAWL